MNMSERRDILTDARKQFGIFVSREQAKRYEAQTGVNLYRLMMRYCEQVGRAQFHISDESLAKMEARIRPSKAPRTPKAPRAPKTPRVEKLEINPAFVGQEEISQADKVAIFDAMRAHQSTSSFIDGDIEERLAAEALRSFGAEDRGKPFKGNSRSDRVIFTHGKEWNIQNKKMPPKNARKGGGVNVGVSMRDPAVRTCLDGSTIRSLLYPFGSFDILVTRARYVTGNSRSLFLCAEWNLTDNSGARKAVSRQLIKNTQEIVLKQDGGHWYLVDSRESFDAAMNEILAEWNADPYARWRIAPAVLPVE